MTFMQSISTCFSKYVVFSGRARRSEYWWFVLFGLIVSIVATRIDTSLFGSGFAFQTDGSVRLRAHSSGVFGPILSLILFLPSVSVMVRRLHDLDKSGWWWFINFVPLIGWIIFIVWMASEGTQGPNRFGNPPTSDAPDTPPEPEHKVEERESPIPDVREDREPTIRRR